MACWSINVACSLLTTVAISLKRVKIEEKLLWRACRKSSMLFRFLGSPPYFYFRFRLYGDRDGRFCRIFVRTAQCSVLDGTNGLSSSKPCAYCWIMQSELKPETVLATIITQKCVNSLKMPINGLGLPCLCLQVLWCCCGGTILLRRSIHLNGLWAIRLHCVS